MTPQARRESLGIVAIAALAYALCDALHELGHLAAAILFPLDVVPVLISSIAVSSSGNNSAWMAAAGPMINVALGFCLLLASNKNLSTAARYFVWLFGTINLFDATAYLLYSAVLGAGDWAVAFNVLAVPAVWRPIAGSAGLALYAGSIALAVRVLRGLVASDAISANRVERCCAVPYWFGGLLLTAASALNPISPWFILTSGAATGFGAMAGLLLVPALLARRPMRSPVGSSVGPLRIDGPWLVAGAAAAALLVGVLGPGVHIR